MSSAGVNRNQVGFEPPPYPYDRLDAYQKMASEFDGGIVDLSIGTPCDPPPQAVIDALAGSGSERGYPASIGSENLRRSIARWMGRRFSIDVPISRIAACIGTKEFVATTPQYMKLRRPGRDTVIYPAVAYPTYEMGAILAGCRHFFGYPITPSTEGAELMAKLLPDLGGQFVQAVSEVAAELRALEAAMAEAELTPAQRIGVLCQMGGIGGERQLLQALSHFTPQGLNQVHHIAAHQRLATGQADLAHPTGDKAQRHAVQLFQAEHVSLRQKSHPLGHAIGAAQVAAIGHRQAEVGNPALELVDEGLRVAHGGYPNTDPARTLSSGRYCPVMPPAPSR